MRTLFHAAIGLSISLGAGAAILGFATSPSDAMQQAANGNGSPYYGRWTVNEEDPKFSSRGREYKNIDIAPCGKDFCGVSVSDSGACGKVLFRFLSKNRNADQLNGHGKWGTAKKNVVIYHWEDDETPPTRGLQIYLGDGYNFGDRGGNMPMYEAPYKRTGVAYCKAK